MIFKDCSLKNIPSLTGRNFPIVIVFNSISILIKEFIFVRITLSAGVNFYCSHKNREKLKKKLLKQQKCKQIFFPLMELKSIKIYYIKSSSFLIHTLICRDIGILSDTDFWHMMRNRWFFVWLEKRFCSAVFLVAYWFCFGCSFQRFSLILV